MLADHGNFYRKTCFLQVGMSYRNELSIYDVKPHWIGFICRPIHLLKLQTLSSYYSCSVSTTGTAGVSYVLENYYFVRICTITVYFTQHGIPIHHF